MKRTLTSVRITLWINRLIALIVAALLFALPFLLDWYRNYRILSEGEYLAIAIAFYCCSLVIAVALWNLEKLLQSILIQSVFTPENVTRIRRIRWCCAGVSLICLPAAFIYLPLFFLVIIMGFLSLVVHVVAQVMAAAVALREENDLTI